jgi:Protein of unknown function (DUF3987)/NrS-1  polymerase HBD domain
MRNDLYRGLSAQQLDSIPAVMKDIPQWVLFKLEEQVSAKGEAKLNKIPIDAKTLQNASSTDPRTWTMLEQCVKALEKALPLWVKQQDSCRGGGIGFVFTPESGIVGIDLDKAIEVMDGKRQFKPWASEILVKLASYSEISPSGTGVHVYAMGASPTWHKKKYHDGIFEVYDTGRFFTVTGQHIKGTPLTLEERQDTLLTVYEMIERYAAETDVPGEPRQTTSSIPLSDADILDRARQARNGGKFSRLFDGDTSIHGGDDSAADLALCCELAFWTQEYAQIDRLFRQSGLMRAKWNAKHGQQTYGDMTIAKALASSKEQYTGGNGHASVKAVDAEPEREWQDLRPLDALLPEVPSLPAEMMPQGLRVWSEDIAERTEVPLEYVAIPALVAASSVCGRQIGIAPKRRDDWVVIPNLWGIVIGRPGLLKTPSMVQAMKPLDMLAATEHDRYEAAVRDAEGREISLKAQIDGLKDAIKRAAKDGKEGEVDGLQSRVNGLLAELVELTPRLRRYKTNDVTIQKLGELLRDNPNGLLMYRDEISGWLGSMEQDGREGDRAFFLETWNGDGTYEFDRVGRGLIRVKHLCLSVLGSIQPGRIQPYVHAASEGGAGDDGLLQRFQLMVWPDSLGKFLDIDRWPNSEARTRAYGIFDALGHLNPTALGAHPLSDYDPQPVMRFEPEAQELFSEWRVEWEQRLRSGAIEAPALEAHLAKYRSLAPSLALLFHLIDCVDGRGGAQVTASATKMALDWCGFLEQHAQKVYAGVVRKNLQAAHALADKIKKGMILSGSVPREIYRNHWAMLSTPEDVYDGLRVLEQVGWLRLTETQTSGRPTEKIILHPTLRKA